MLLVEGIGGDIGPYEEHLRRTGISSRPEAEVIKILQTTREEAYDTLDDIILMIRDNLKQNKKFTVIHCYLSVSPENLRLDGAGRIEIQMQCGNFFPIQKSLNGFKANR